MKRIAYTRADGGLSVLSPAEGARLALSVRLADGAALQSPEPCPVDTFLRGWPVDGAAAEWAESEDAFLARIIAKDVPAGASSVQVIDASAIPEDRTFRNAWRANVAGIYCDMPAARELARGMLRRERAERFKLLDGAWMRSMARGESIAAAAVEAKREALRAWPADPRLDTCAASDDLKSLLQTMKAEVI